MYTLDNRKTVSYRQIISAQKLGQTVIINRRTWSGHVQTLMIDGQHFDTRGQCDHHYDERWTTRPTSIAAALEIANHGKITIDLEH